MKVKSVSTGHFSLYVEGDMVREQMRGGFMDDVTYAAMVDHTIIVCTDAVVVDPQRRTFFLARRVARPMKGLWWIGGRRRKGETPQEAMCRNFLRETGLSLPSERFDLATIMEYLWQDREQEPSGRGSHNLAHQFTVCLTPTELATAAHNLDQREYDLGLGLQEFDRARLVTEHAHHAILDLYDTVFP